MPPPNSKIKATIYPIDGIIKHAQVARILYKNKVTPAEFYIAARLCQEHLPPSTYQSLAAETCRQKAKSKPILAPGLYTTVRRLEQRGLLQIIPAHPYKRLEATKKGWLFYLLLLAEMERPVRDCTVFDYPKKTKWQGPRHEGKAGAVTKTRSFLALSQKRGLSIWERCALSSLPPYQRLESGVPKSPATDSAPSSTPPSTGPAIEPKKKP